MPEVAVLIPLLKRPHRVLPLVKAFADATDMHRVRLVFMCTRGDNEVIEAVNDAIAGFVPFSTVQDIKYLPVGDYARKINTGMTITDEPFAFLAADDLLPHHGWLDAGLAKFDLPRIGVVGTQDLGSPRVKRGIHSTHSFVSRHYVEEFGLIDKPGLVLYEGYPHEFVDDEFIQTAQSREAFVFARQCVVEHLHPSWGKAELDDLYRDEPRRMKLGRVIFAQRRRLWT